MPIQIQMRRFRGPPIRRDLRKLPYHQGLDVRLARLFIVQIRSDIAYVGISQANDLPGIAGIGEDFLISGETGIENDFTAAARRSPRGAPVKKPPVLEREDSGP